jgi:DNA-binding LacI/PurR family transcriptional regulator
MNRTAAVSMADISRHLGLSVATVSRALRQHPAISADTRVAVRAAAVELGYRPNPLVGALMTQLRQGGGSSPVNLACLHGEEPSENMTRAIRTIVDGFQTEAVRLGYHVAVDRWPPRQGDELGIVRRWRARNVHGVLLCNVRGDRELDFPWAEFCWVVAGNMGGTPALVRVGNEIHQLVKLALREALRRGCRRPGLAVPVVGERRQGLRWAGAFLGNSLELQPEVAKPLVFRDRWNEAAFRRWLRAARPDAVLALTDDVFEWLQRAVPRRGGRRPLFLHLAANTSAHPVAGVVQEFAAVGAAAAQLLDGQLRRNERGAPAHPSTLTVAGGWRAG